MDIITSERARVKQQIQIEQLQEEKYELENLIKEIRVYNNLSLEERKKTNNQILDLQNRVRTIEKKISMIIFKEEPKNNLIDIIKSILK